MMKLSAPVRIKRPALGRSKWPACLCLYRFDKKVEEGRRSNRRSRWNQGSYRRYRRGRTRRRRTRSGWWSVRRRRSKRQGLRRRKGSCEGKRKRSTSSSREARAKEEIDGGGGRADGDGDVYGPHAKWQRVILTYETKTTVRSGEVIASLFCYGDVFGGRCTVGGREEAESWEEDFQRRLKDVGLWLLPL